MLRRAESGEKPVLGTYGFLVSVELVEGKVDPSTLTGKLAESLTWVDHVGKIDVDLLGKVDVVDE